LVFQAATNPRLARGRLAVAEIVRSLAENGHTFCAAGARAAGLRLARSLLLLRGV
jgi:hypothetical protein